MAGMAIPHWLAKRGGALEPSTQGDTWLVLLGNSPEYRLVPIPMAGAYGCAVTRTVDGRRLDGTGTYPCPEDAVRGGLEDLRKTLGW
jgi:hypothetical protein